MLLMLMMIVGCRDCKMKKSDPCIVALLCCITQLTEGQSSALLIILSLHLIIIVIIIIRIIILTSSQQLKQDTIGVGDGARRGYVPPKIHENIFLAIIM